MRITPATLFLVISAIGGCVWEGPERIETAGQHPALGAAEPMSSTSIAAEVDTGRLLVFTPRMAYLTVDDAARSAGPYMGYNVYDEGGRKIAHETNRAGARDEGPVELKLAPGRYFVRLDEPVEGLREFWVTVERGKVTRVENKGWSGTPPYVR